MANRRITYDVGFNVNKSGLTQVEKAMDAIRDLTSRDIALLNKTSVDKARDDLREIRDHAINVQEAFQKAFNYKLNTVNIEKFNRELSKTSSKNLNEVYKGFKKAGAAGENAFRTLTAQTLKNNFQLKETSSLLQEIGTTFKNTIKWNIASSAINTLTGSIQQAYGYVKNLDTSLNDIRIVTGASADAMDVFAQKANKAAGELKKSTTDYTNAALIYYQQGLGDEEVAARTEVTLKAANVTGQDTAEVSEQLTAIWNGYKVQAAEAELYIDKVAAVAARTASDLEELATGMSKVASAADLMGVDIDQLNAQIATIISVTRQAPESVGTALKTIYARMGDIEAGIDTETTLGNYTEQMAAMGVNVLDMNGQLRDMGEVIEEIGGKWSTMSREQQIALSQVMAGTRQYNNLLSLFDNWDMYTEALETSANAAGTLQEQQDIFADSAKANLQELATAAEGVFDSLLNADMINSVAGFLTPLVQGVEHFIDSLGGGMGILRVFGPLLLKSFGPEISENILKFSKNLKAAEHNATMMENQLKLLEQFQGIEGLDESTKMLFENQEALTLLSSTMKLEEFNEMSAQIQDYTEKINEQATAQDKANKISERYSKALGKNISFKELFEVDDWDKIGTVITRNVEQAEDALTLLGDSFQQLDIDNHFYEEILSKDFISQDLADKLKIDFSKIIDEKSFNEAKDKLTNFISNAQNLVDEENADEISQINTELQKFSQEAEEAGQSITDYLSDQAFETRIQGFVDLGSAVMSAVGSLQTLAGIDDIWNDENLSVGEKLVQTMMAIGTSAVSLKGAWETARGALDKFTATSRTEALVTLEQAAANEVENATERASTTENARNTTSVIAQTNAEAAEAATSGVQAGTNAAKSAGALKTIGSAIGKTFSGAAAAIGMSTASLGVLLGVIAAVGVAIYAGVKAWNKDKDAAEDAAKAYETVSKQYEETKQKYDELISSIENYRSAQEAIKSLTIGTQEWKDAIQEANLQVLELLDKYPQLAQYVSNIDGQLTISDKGFEVLQQEQNRQVQTAYQQKLSGQINKIETQTDYKITTVGREIGTSGWTNEGTEEFLLLIDKYGETVLKDSQSMFEAYVKEYGDWSGSLSAEYFESIVQNRDALLELDSTIQANNKATLELKKQLGNSVAVEKQSLVYESSSEKDQQLLDILIGNEIVKKDDEQTYREALGELAKQLNIEGGLQGSFLDDTLHNYAADLFGWTEIGGAKSGHQMFKDEKTGEEFELSDEEISRRVYLQLQKDELDIDKLKKELENFQEIVETQFGNEDLLSSFIGGQEGSLLNATQEQLEALKATDIAKFASENFEAAGFETAEDFQEALQNAIDTADFGFESLRKNLSNNITSTFNNLNLNNATLAAQLQIKDILNNAFNYLGKEGLQSAGDAINSLLNSGLSSNEIETVLTKITETDFSNTSIEEFNKQLQQMGVYIDENKLQILINSQLAASQSTDTLYNSISNLNASLSTLYDLIQNTAMGDIVSKENYETLIALNPELAKYFSLMADGENYIYTASQNLSELTSVSEIYAASLEKTAKQKEIFDSLMSKKKGTVVDSYSDLASFTNQEIISVTGLSEDAVKAFSSEVKRLQGIVRSQEEFDEQVKAYVEKQGLTQAFDTFLNISKGYIETTENLMTSVSSAAQQGYKEFLAQKEVMLQNQDSLLGEVDKAELERLEKTALSVEAKNRGIDEEEFKAYVESLGNTLSAYKTALTNLSERSGVEQIASGWEDIKEKIDAAKGSAVAMAEPLAQMKEWISTSFGEELSTDFFTEEIYSLFDKISEGGEDAAKAFEELKIKVQAESIKVKYSISPEDAEKLDLEKLLNSINLLEIGFDLSEEDSIILDSLLKLFGDDEQKKKSFLISLGIEENPFYTNEIIPGAGSIFQQISKYRKDTPKTDATGVTAGIPNPEGEKEKQKDFVDILEVETDKFHDINLELELYNNNLKILQREQEDLSGTELIENLHKQHELQQQILATEERKLAMQKEEVELSKKNLGSMGVEFDGDIVSNYEEILNAKIKAVQDAQQYYNNLVSNGAEDEALESAKKSIDAAEKNREKTEEAIKEYEQLITKDIPETSEKIAEMLDELDASDIIDDIIDKFYDLDNELKALEKELSDLEREASRLEGQELINNLEQQKKVIDRQIEAQKRKIEIQKIEMANQQQMLKNYVSELLLKHKIAGIELQFNAAGMIANYAEVMGAIAANAEKMTESEIKMLETLLNAYQQAYENTTNMADELENLYNTKQDIDWDIEDEYERMAEEAAKKLEEEMNERLRLFNLEVDLKLDVAEARRQWNEFKRKVIDDIDDDDILGNAKARFTDFFSYYGDELGSIGVLTKHVNDIMNEINIINAGGVSSLYGTDKEQAIEDMKNYRDQLVTALEEIVDLQNELEDSYLEMIDKITDKFNEQVELYGMISDTISHDMELIRLIRGEDSYDELSKYYEQQQENDNAQLALLRSQVDYWKSRMDSAEEGSEEWEKYKENWKSAVSELNSTVDTSVQNLIDKYQNMVNKVFEDLNNSVTNYVGLDYLSEEWDLINKNADKYLDKVNSLFEINSLENKFQQAIDDTDSLKAQQRLTEVMNEQLEMLREKDKLTQYDVDRANLLYELELKKIALEEAQQNKSQLRLRRDSQGNYSYQYVADQEAVGNAEQELSEAQNSVYNLDKDQYNQNLNEIYDLYTEFQEKLSALYQDQTLTEEEREQKKQLLVANYGELINGVIAENESIRQNLQQSTFDSLAGLYGMSVEEFQNMTDAQKEIMMNQMIPEWDSGLQEMADRFAGEDGFITMCEEAIKLLEEATLEYQNGLSALEEAAGINFGSLLDEGIDPTISQTQELINTNDELIGKYEQELDVIGSLISELDSLREMYGEIEAAAIAAVEAALRLQEANTTGNMSASGGGSTTTSSTSTTSGGGSGSGSGDSDSGDGEGGSGSGGGRGKADPPKAGDEPSSGGSGDGVPKKGDKVTLTSGTLAVSSDATSTVKSMYPAGTELVVSRVMSKGNYPIHLNLDDPNHTNKSAWVGWVNTSMISGYDTGGYTGEWGSSGKLALLHEKELILNKQDTPNILAAVSMVRDMSSVLSNLESSAFSQIAGLINVTAQAPNIMPPTQTLEQNVRIEANFPNVSSSNEIEQAFNNLVNVASQHAFNTKR